MMYGGLRATELMIILGTIAPLFGAKKIPELARGMGKGINEFKKGLKETEKEMKDDGK